MPGALDPEDAFAEFTRLTQGSLGDARDFFTLTPAEQSQALWNYRHMAWAKSPDTLKTILEVLGIIATIAGDVSGAAGAIAALRAL